MRFGKKKIYLPKFTIAMIRTPNLAPNLAHFEVPLTLTKLDIKDYLYHLYATQVLSVRSYVLGVGRTPKHFRGKKELNRKFRKRMIVELVEPFVYPEEVKDKSPWDHNLYQAAYKNEEVRRDVEYGGRKVVDKTQRSAIQKAASEVLAQRGLKKGGAKAPMK